MTTHFITAEVEINENQDAIAKNLIADVEQQLAQHGQPLRWAITEVNTEASTGKQTATVEAVVTRN